MAETIYGKIPQAGLSFANKTASPVVKLKKQAKLYSDVEINQLNIMLFGTWQTGKTYSIVSLLELGYKIFYVTTDLGSNGLLSVHNRLRELNKLELKKNIAVLDLSDYEEASDFLSNPVKYFPEFYDFDTDILFWDGYSNFQQYHIKEKVGGMVPERKSGVSEAREAGLQFEQTDWGQIASATLKSIDKFFRLHNKKNGKVWHKIVTFQPKYGQKKVGDKQEWVEYPVPAIQGQAANSIGAGFDLIIHTKSSGDVFKYEIRTEGCKCRGFTLPKEMDADFNKLWTTVTEQAGIKLNMKDEQLIEKE